MVRFRPVAVVTGNSADWGLLRPVVEHLSVDYEVDLLVLDQHLLTAPSDRVHMVSFWEAGDRHGAFADEYTRVFNRSVQWFKEVRYGAVIVLGDRVEILAAVTAAYLTEQRLLHLYAGEVSGCKDDDFRDMISRMSYAVMPVSLDAEKRLRCVAELMKRAKFCCIPVAPVIEQPNSYLLAQHLNIQRPYAVICFHPETSTEEPVEDWIEDVEEKTQGMQRFVFPPNRDPGWERITEAYKRNRLDLVGTRLPRSAFLALLKGAHGLYGNSSAFVHEAPLVDVPAERVFLYGQRQRERLPGDVTRPNALEQICTTVRQLLGRSDE